MDYKNMISEFINTKKDDMIALLMRFAKIPSVLGEEQENMPFGKDIDDILRLAISEAESLGLVAKCYENRADIVKLNDKEEKLAILCHLDVVPATAEGWTNPPFEPTVVENMIYGRGVSDNKGPAVAALYALYAIKELGIPLKRNVMLYLGGCEENRCADLQYYLKKNKLPECVFTPDACFPVGNAERGRIVVTCNTDFQSSNIVSINAGRGVNIVPDYAEAILCDVDGYELEMLIHKAHNVQFSIEKENNLIILKAYGKSTHSAHPKDGINALTALLTILSAVDDNTKLLAKHFPHNVFDGSGLGLDGGLDISITQLKIKNGRMFFTADGRVNLGVSSKVLAERIEKNITYPVEMLVKEPHHTDEKADIVKKLNDVYEEYTGRDSYTYTLDAMTYAHEADGSVIFGGVVPGDGSENAHGINERYNLDTFIEAAKIFAGAIIEICEVEAEK